MKHSICKLPALLITVLLVCTFAACKKDNSSVNDGQVTLLSFGPTGAKHGDTLRFFGRNLHQVTEVAFTGTNAAVKQADFKQQNSELILLVVPQTAEKGFVTLKAPQGDVVSKTQFNLNVTTRVTAMPASARPGENITLTGNYLNWVKNITFAKGKVVSTFVNKSLTQLVVTVPADAETGPLLIAYGGTDSMVVETTDTLRVKLPVATGFAPNPVKHANDVTITGTDIDLTTQVIFAGTTTPVTSFVSKTATQLVVKVPAAAQKGRVTLVPASGVPSPSTVDMNVLLPAITNMAPSPVDPGANLTITGTNLDLASSVIFQNAPPVTSMVSQSATQIVVKVPNGVLRGKVSLGVINSTLTVQSNDVLEITGDAPPPTLALAIYTDAVSTNWTNGGGWIGGGWGGNKDYNNSSPVREGTRSIKIDYVGGWGSPMQLGGANIGLAPYTTFKLSIFGAPGSNGKKVNLALNGGGNASAITVVEGKWTDYAIPFSSLGSPSSLKEIWLQEYNGTGGFTIYVDAIGLH